MLARSGNTEVMELELGEGHVEWRTREGQMDYRFWKDRSLARVVLLEGSGKVKERGT